VPKTETEGEQPPKVSPQIVRKAKKRIRSPQQKERDAEARRQAYWKRVSRLDNGKTDAKIAKVECRGPQRETEQSPPIVQWNPPRLSPTIQIIPVTQSSPTPTRTMTNHPSWNPATTVFLQSPPRFLTVSLPQTPVPVANNQRIQQVVTNTGQQEPLQVQRVFTNHSSWMKQKQQVFSNSLR